MPKDKPSQNYISSRMNNFSIYFFRTKTTAVLTSTFQEYSPISNHLNLMRKEIVLWQLGTWPMNAWLWEQSTPSRSSNLRKASKLSRRESKKQLKSTCSNAATTTCKTTSTSNNGPTRTSFKFSSSSPTHSSQKSYNMTTSPLMETTSVNFSHSKPPKSKNLTRFSERKAPRPKISNTAYFSCKWATSEI